MQPNQRVRCVKLAAVDEMLAHQCANTKQDKNGTGSEVAELVQDRAERCVLGRAVSTWAQRAAGAERGQPASLIAMALAAVVYPKSQATSTSDPTSRPDRDTLGSRHPDCS